MPDNNGKGKGGNNPGGGPDDTRENDDKAQWLHPLSLYLADPTWAKDVYDAIWKTKQFRLIAKGKVLASVPDPDTGSHSNDDVVKWEDSEIKFDSAGCLIIVDPQLAKDVTEAHDLKCFYIVKDASSGPITEQKTNAMCPC